MDLFPQGQGGGPALGRGDRDLVPTRRGFGYRVERHGYLVTERFGCRVRLAAVFTELELIADSPVDIGVRDFCDFCRKCATNCPSRSIPDAEPVIVNGSLRWKLNAETCFDYWAKLGTDCNICMRVCPWSHARTFPHRVVRQLCVRNRYSRRLFTEMDDLFYGRKPKPRPLPDQAGFARWLKQHRTG
jgi:hypothetical protein